MPVEDRRRFLDRRGDPLTDSWTGYTPGYYCTAMLQTGIWQDLYTRE